MSALSRVLDEVQRERQAQDDRWGGAAHDDEHTSLDWAEFILERTYRVTTQDPAASRRNLIEIAALAVAAIEAKDRKAAK